MASLLSKGVGITGAQKFANQTVERSALLTDQKARAEEIQAAELKIDSMGADQSMLRSMSRGEGAGQDKAIQAAAIQRTVASNDVKGMSELWDASRGWTGTDAPEMRSVLAKSMESSSGRPAYYGAGAIAQMKLGGHSTVKDTIVSAVNDGAYSAAKIATADKDELTSVAQVVHQKLVDDASAAYSDPELRRTMGKNLKRIEAIKKGSPVPPTETLT
jgi:hypothetical protein